MQVVDMFFNWGQSLIYAFYNLWNWFQGELKRIVLTVVSAVGKMVPGLSAKIGSVGLDIYLQQKLPSFSLFDLLFSIHGLRALFFIGLFVIVKRAVF